jgi:tRNA(fMet)-specific endonuclease VapC
MSTYILDTDIVGFVQQANPTVLQRLHILSPADVVATTIITTEEDIGGWLPACRRARNGTARVQAYARLQEALRFYQRIAWLPFTDAAATLFDQLQGQKLRLGTNDLCIAAITLSVGGILVTRNSKDFRRIPGLTMEDWTL